MTVLTSPKTWRRPMALTRTRTPDLTESERANLARALRFLQVRAGSGAKLAAALGVCAAVVERGVAKQPRGTASLALRAARLSGQPIDSILLGYWPEEGACPHCGR